MKKIALSGKNGLGKFALVDDEDFEEMSRYAWRADKAGYIYRNTCFKDTVTTIFMHRQIMETPIGMGTDHKDMDKSNNQRNNLRICTYSQNRGNVNAPKNNTSGFKGLVFRTDCGKWCARITVKHKTFRGGSYNTKEEAALAYNRLAVKHFGEFARLNIIGSMDSPKMKHKDDY